MVDAAAKRVFACVVLVAITGSLVLPIAGSGHLGEHGGAVCEAGVRIASSEERIEELSPLASFTHCVLCHWLRLISSSRAPTPVTAGTWLDHVGFSIASSQTEPAATVVILRPSRAPPVHPA